VSNAFSRPDQLSADLRDRILATATELGYTGPDPAARALARGSVGTIGLLLTDALQGAFTDEIATRLLAAISEQLSESGRGLTLLGSEAHGALVPARDIPLDGALVYACSSSSAAIDWLRRRKVPLVYLDQEPVTGYPCLNVDDRGGARAAAQHLVDLGHRRVALITKVEGPAGPLVGSFSGGSFSGGSFSGGSFSGGSLDGASFTARRRMEGWLEPLIEVGVEPIIVNAAASTEDAGQEAARWLLDLPATLRPSAVLAYSDRIALGVMQALQDAGIDVPGDVSIVGFDDAFFAERTRPPLTTVRQDVGRKGREATALLCAAIDTRAPQVTDHRLLPTELVVRSSTQRLGARTGRVAAG
jgi:DNA-binding LacI/PurR family transcriptional regulator